ncbi:MAG TPA: UDP-N-acetylmuramoyl-L-alanine--D-glutamate ligase [Candidatus Paceibacterota bacterium]|nr:UDP-N-acetylmuramoyl-L-alanine--D-glutamate ligase [Candidatus Paceibacterota bacterium]
MDASSYFRGKKITVMGLGLLGRGVGDAHYLAECGAELIVTDLKSREELAASVAKLQSFPNITFVLGEHRLEDFRDRDLILKAAGVPLDSPYIAEAERNHIPVRMSADLLVELSKMPVVGITGTRGKSTATHMVEAILRAAGKKVLVGGNVRGVSNLSLLPEATPEHIAILELDSWQLQGFGAMRMSPHISIFTTFFPDHLNYYKNDLDRYLADKACIFLNQSENDVLILGRQCAPIVIEKYGEQIRSKVLVVDEMKLPDTWTLKVPGVHNRNGAALALAAARELGVPDDVSRTALADFPGVPGRLELVREKDGIQIYNDTTSTTPEATIAALEALPAERTVLIMGGTDKNLDLAELSARAGEAKKVVLLAGNGTDRIRAEFPNAPIFDDLEAAVSEACKEAEKGDIVLFSPGFTSFGMFKNEFDRGDRFDEIVKAL